MLSTAPLLSENLAHDDYYNLKVDLGVAYYYVFQKNIIYRLSNTACSLQLHDRTETSHMHNRAYNFSTNKHFQFILY